MVVSVYVESAFSLNEGGWVNSLINARFSFLTKDVLDIYGSRLEVRLFLSRLKSHLQRISCRLNDQSAPRPAIIEPALLLGLTVRGWVLEVDV